MMLSTNMPMTMQFEGRLAAIIPTPPAMPKTRPVQMPNPPSWMPLRWATLRSMMWTKAARPPRHNCKMLRPSINFCGNIFSIFSFSSFDSKFEGRVMTIGCWLGCCIGVWFSVVDILYIICDVFTRFFFSNCCYEFDFMHCWTITTVRRRPSCCRAFFQLQTLKLSSRSEKSTCTEFFLYSTTILLVYLPTKFHAFGN